jgi:hypothetical protein
LDEEAGVFIKKDGQWCLSPVRTAKFPVLGSCSVSEFGSEFKARSSEFKIQSQGSRCAVRDMTAHSEHGTMNMNRTPNHEHELRTEN